MRALARARCRHGAPAAYKSTGKGEVALEEQRLVRRAAVAGCGEQLAVVVGQADEHRSELVHVGAVKGYVIPGGGSNALGGLGYVACAAGVAAADRSSRA